MEDEEMYQLTPYGVLYLTLNQYGFDTSKLTSTIGNHMLEDLVKGLMKIEYLPEMEFKDED